MMSQFRKGKKVERVLRGPGALETKEIRIVGKVSKGVVYLEDDFGSIETGITFDLHGKEREGYFPGMRAEIRLIEGGE